MSDKLKITDWKLNSKDLKEFIKEDREAFCRGGYFDYITTTFLCGLEQQGVNIEDINPDDWIHLLEISPYWDIENEWMGNALDWFYNKKSGKLIKGHCNLVVGWHGAEIYNQSDLKEVPSEIKKKIQYKLSSGNPDGNPTEAEIAWRLEFVVRYAWNMPEVADAIGKEGFRRIANPMISWDENLRKAEEKHPVIRETRLERHFAGLPGEIFDYIDFKSETDPKLTFDENIKEIVGKHHLEPRLEELSPEEIETREQIHDMMALEAGEEEIGERIEEVMEAYKDGEKRELREFISERYGAPPERPPPKPPEETLDRLKNWFLGIVIGGGLSDEEAKRIAKDLEFDIRGMAEDVDAERISFDDAKDRIRELARPYVKPIEIVKPGEILPRVEVELKAPPEYPPDVERVAERMMASTTLFLFGFDMAFREAIREVGYADRWMVYDTVAKYISGKGRELVASPERMFDPVIGGFLAEHVENILETGLQRAYLKYGFDDVWLYIKKNFMDLYEKIERKGGITIMLDEREATHPAGRALILLGEEQIWEVFGLPPMMMLALIRDEIKEFI